MGEELNRSLRLLAERGQERGAVAVLDDARAEAAVAGIPGGPSWRAAWLLRLERLLV